MPLLTHAGSLQRISLKFIRLPIKFDLIPWQTEASPQHDGTTTMLYLLNGVFRMIHHQASSVQRALLSTFTVSLQTATGISFLFVIFLCNSSFLPLIFFPFKAKFGSAPILSTTLTLTCLCCALCMILLFHQSPLIKPPSLYRSANKMF